MKKFLAFVFVVAVVGVAGSARAMDRSGKFGIGVQESFTGSGPLGTNYGAWSLKYGVNDAINAQLVFGFDMVNEGGNNQALVGGKATYDLVQNENSDFYTGVGLAVDIDNNANVLRVQIPLGWEWSFASLPEVGFSMEAGVYFDTQLSDTTGTGKASGFSSVGGLVGGNLGLGIHYYF